MIDIVRDFLLEPVILIGVIVFIGLVLQYSEKDLKSL